MRRTIIVSLAMALFVWAVQVVLSSLKVYLRTELWRNGRVIKTQYDIVFVDSTIPGTGGVDLMLYLS